MIGKGKSTFFLVVTLAHDFFFVRKGWRHLSLFLNRYHMAESHTRYIDPEGFFDILRERTKAKSTTQKVYLPKDIIRNIFSLQEQEVMKDKWIVFNKFLEFINAFDSNYDSLKDKKYWGAKMYVLMNNFSAIMQTMNEKKATYVKTYPDRVADVQRRINNKNIGAPGQYTLQKRAGYVIMQNVH